MSTYIQTEKSSLFNCGETVKRCFVLTEKKDKKGKKKSKSPILDSDDTTKFELKAIADDNDIYVFIFWEDILSQALFS